MVARIGMTITGLDNLDRIKKLKKDIPLAAVRTLNRVTERARTVGAKRIREEVAFPASYLNPAQKKLYVAKKANKGSLEAVIRASDRATSLSRFVSSGSEGKMGVTVQVSPGKSRQMRKAFLMKLRSGASSINTKHNLGLAIRLRNGETVRNKKSFKRIKGNLYLLYGPSVDQVFIGKDRSGVAARMEPEILDSLQQEFFRVLGID